MKTRSDYYTKVLGLKLKGVKTHFVPQNNDEGETESCSKSVSDLEKNFYFLAEDSDIEKSKEMISKLLQALKRSADEIFIHQDEAKKLKETQVLFSFGVDVQSLKSVKTYKTLFHISKDQTLKLKLWNDLKKLI